MNINHGVEGVRNALRDFSVAEHVIDAVISMRSKAEWFDFYNTCKQYAVNVDLNYLIFYTLMLIPANELKI